jgi:signal transduction histidine kinase
MSRFSSGTGPSGQAVRTAPPSTNTPLAPDPPDWGSGPLGPLEPPFADVCDDSRATPAISLDAAREQMECEHAYLRDRLRTLTNLLEQSEEHLAERTQRHAAALEQVQIIEPTLPQYGRPEIKRCYQELGAAEVALVEMRETCVHLRAQIETTRRALDAIELALGAISSAERQFHVEPEEVTPPPEPAQPSLTLDFQSLFAAREQERHTIARHIEERICGALSKAISRGEHCDAVLRNEPGRAGEVVAMFKHRLNQALHEARMLSFELEPNSLADYGLATTLETYIHDIAETRGIAITAQVEAVDRRYPLDVERAAFHTAREALANIVRHACAAHARVVLRQTGEGLMLTIQDDGVGFDVTAVTEAAYQRQSGLGQICREAELLGATLVVESGPGKGTRIDYLIAAPARTTSSILSV